MKGTILALVLMAATGAHAQGNPRCAPLLGYMMGATPGNRQMFADMLQQCEARQNGGMPDYQRRPVQTFCAYDDYGQELACYDRMSQCRQTASERGGYCMVEKR